MLNELCEVWLAGFEEVPMAHPIKYIVEFLSPEREEEEDCDDVDGAPT